MTTEDILLDAKKRAGYTEDDTVLLRWMNQEYDQVNALIAKIDPEYFLTTSDLVLEAGTAIYKLPATFSRSLIIEDENEEEVPKVSRLDPEKPEGWFFAGTVIEAEVRYERIRIQDTPAAAKTWTLWYIERPPVLDNDTNTVPYWPPSVHELLVIGVLLRWMESEEEDERYKQYLQQRKELRRELFDLVADRMAGKNETPLITNPEDLE